MTDTTPNPAHRRANGPAAAVRRAAAIVALLAVTASCAPTTIVGDLTTTTSPAATTSTTLAPPTGSVRELLAELSDLTVGLGDVVVEGDNDTARARLDRAVAIGAVLVDRVTAAGVDLVEDIERIVGLIRTAVERKRPADADKAQRFTGLIIEAAANL